MSTDPHLDDDRLSALIDGEAPPDDLAHAAACPECSTRVVAWRGVSHLVSIPPEPPSGARRDAAVEAALKAGAVHIPASEDYPGARPVPLAARRDRGQPRGPRARIGSRIAAAAAAVIVIVGVAVAVSNNGGSSSKSSSAGSTASPSTLDDRAAAPVTPSTLVVPSAGAGSQTPGPTAAPSARPEVLSGDQSPASIVRSLQAALAQTPSGINSIAQASPSALAFAPCLNRAAADVGVRSGSVPALEASLTYQGAPAQVFVFPVGAGHVAAVVGGPGCTLLTHVAF